MSFEELELLKFYCWQLNIKTLKELSKFRNETNSKSNKELLNNLTIKFNRV